MSRGERYGSGAIEVVDYDLSWPALFEREQRAVAQALGSRVIAVEHVGSTAVPGLAAKPIIDLLAIVHDLDEIRTACVECLARLGYVHLAGYEAWLPDRMLFRKGVPGPWTHHLHIMEPASPRREELILIRNYLRRHPETAVDYADLKRMLAARWGDDIAAYRDGKAPFLRTLLAQAWKEMVR